VQKRTGRWKDFGLREFLLGRKEGGKKWFSQRLQSREFWKGKGSKKASSDDVWREETGREGEKNVGQCFIVGHRKKNSAKNCGKNGVKNTQVKRCGNYGRMEKCDSERLHFSEKRELRRRVMGGEGEEKKKL